MIPVFKKVGKWENRDEKEIWERKGFFFFFFFKRGWGAVVFPFRYLDSGFQESCSFAGSTGVGENWLDLGSVLELEPIVLAVTKGR